ncbi:hypothetical protein Dimus_031621, partial [Dionaea muscipula]
KQRAEKKRTERKAKYAEVPVDDNEAPAENVENVEVIEGEEVQQDFYGEQVEEDVEIKGEEQVEEEAEVQGEPRKKKVVVKYSKSWSRPLKTSSRLRADSSAS